MASKTDQELKEEKSEDKNYNLKLYFVVAASKVPPEELVDALVEGVPLSTLIRLKETLDEKLWKKYYFTLREER